MGGPCTVNNTSQPDFTDNFQVKRFVLGGVEFFCIEHAFQTIKFKDPKDQEKISSLRPEAGPREAAFGMQSFRAGQQRLPSFRTEWDGIKAEVMYRATRAKFIQNSDVASQLLATGEATVTRPDDMDGFWRLWNCNIIKRIRIELKPPAERSQTEIQTLQDIQSKFELWSSINGGDETISSTEFNACCPQEPYDHEGRAQRMSTVVPAVVKTPVKQATFTDASEISEDIVEETNEDEIMALFQQASEWTDGTMGHEDAKKILVGVGVDAATCDLVLKRVPKEDGRIQLRQFATFMMELP